MVESVAILLVDDDPRFRERMADLTERKNAVASVTTAPDGATAIDRLESGSYDCVVSDLRMPGADGLDLAAEVRSRHPELPFVLVTAAGSEETASEAFSAGVSEYFRKDADPALLVRRIRHLVERARAERERRATTERYEALIEESSDLIAVVAPDGEITYHSDSVVRTLGVDPDELVGENVLDLIHPDDRERTRETLTALRETPAGEGRTRRQEVRLQDIDGDWRWFESTVRTTDAAAVDGFVVNSRDVTARRRRETSIRAVHDATRSMMAAGDRSVVERIVVDTAEEALGLDLVAVYRFDEDSSRLVPTERGDAVDEVMGDLPTFDRGEGVAWAAFAAGETRLHDDVRNAEAVYDLDTPIRGGLVVPIGTYGILIAGSRTVAAFDEVDGDTAETLCANAEAALEQLDRERRLRDREAELERQTEERQRMTHLLDTARSTLGARFEGATRAEIEAAVCEQLANADPYRFAWLGRIDAAGDRLDPAVTRGVEDAFPESLALTVAADPASTPGARAAATGELAVVRDALDVDDDRRREDALRRNYRSVLGVPIIHEDRTIGALEVYAGEPERFDDRERAVLADLGRGVGYAVDTVDRRGPSGDAATVTASFEVASETLFCWRLAAQVGRPVHHRGTSRDDDGAVTLFVAVEGADPDAVAAAAEAVEGRDGRVVGTDPTVLRAKTTAPLAVRSLSAHGGRLRALTVADGVGELEAAFPRRADVRAFADALAPYADSVDLRGCERRSPDDDGIAAAKPTERPRQALTDRQLELLQAAHFGGYFERSRRITGEELAAAYDLNHSTVYEHLRAGQRRVFDELFGPERRD
jgi:PAS domain S-box-containing protein